MALYVARPPDPAPGFDWSYEIPGQYIEDVRSVTATLTTLPGGAVTAADSSGNGFDGTYHGLNNAGWFRPGIVSGDLAILTGTLITGPRTWLSSPVAVASWAGFSFACWATPEAATALVHGQFYFVADLPMVGPTLIIAAGGATGDTLRIDGPFGFWQTAAGVIPVNGPPVMIAVTWDGATMIGYIDGAVVPWVDTPFLPITTTAMGPGRFGSQAGAIANSTFLIDEWAVWPSAIGAGDIAAMFAARSTTFSAYTAAVLATGVQTYYHLDDGALGAGRTPAIELTDGTHVVGRFPSGFPAATGSATYQYTWSTRQGSNAQTSSGSVTTASLPPLIMPAGYTIGTFTPGLGGLDQWSDIAIWWDSGFMDAADNPYEYPPGQHLVYVQDPNAPYD